MDYIYDLKPFNWIKGSLMVFIGILSTRWEIGVGRVNVNISFGLIIYFFIAISGMLIILAFKIYDVAKAEKNRIQFKRIWLISAIIFVIALSLSIYHTIYYNLTLANIFFLSFFGILLFLFVYYGPSKGWEAELGSLIRSLVPSFGVLYGAALNNFPIPIVTFAFFGAVFFLQSSKDLMNECKFIEKDKRNKYKSFAITLGEVKTQKLSLIMDILIIVLLIFPSIPNLLDILSEILYTIPMCVAVILIAIAAFLTFRMSRVKTHYRATKILLRIAMFFVLTSFVLANF